NAAEPAGPCPRHPSHRLAARPTRGDAAAATRAGCARRAGSPGRGGVSGDGDDFVQARQALTAAHAARQVFLRAAEQGLQQAGPLEPRVDLAAVVSELEHILTDLESALDAELEYVSVGEPRPDPLG